MGLAYGRGVLKGGHIPDLKESIERRLEDDVFHGAVKNYNRSIGCKTKGGGSDMGLRWGLGSVDVQSTVCHSLTSTYVWIEFTKR